MPIILDCSLNELQEKARDHLAIYTNTIREYDEAKEKQEENLQKLLDITENHENIAKKLDSKTEQNDRLIEKLDDEKSKHYEIIQQIKKLTNKSFKLNNDILKYQDKLKQLTKNQSKVNYYLLFLYQKLFNYFFRNQKNLISSFDLFVIFNKNLMLLIIIFKQIKIR